MNNLFEKDNPKVAPVLFNNGCVYFFMGNKPKAIEYLNRSINLTFKISLYSH